MAGNGVTESVIVAMSGPGDKLTGMTPPDAKTVLKRYLQAQREALLWKLDGLSDYDGRRPLTPTGTNLLGLVKHVATMELGYFGDCFGRPFPDPPAWYDRLEDEANVELWATADESAESIVALYRAAWAHSDATIDSRDLDAPGRVPWWGDRAEVTLQQVLVHVIAESARHAGHADVVREMIDGAAGLRADNGNLPDEDAAWWQAYRARVQQAADQFRAEG
jgi:uncharacterized damage-inducible protein DinB